MSEVNAEVGSPIPNGPISGPTAWRVAELGPNTDWIVHFMPEELGEIVAAVHQQFVDGREMDRISCATFQLPQFQERLRPPSRWTEGHAQWNRSILERLASPGHAGLHRKTHAEFCGEIAS